MTMLKNKHNVLALFLIVIFFESTCLKFDLKILSIALTYGAFLIFNLLPVKAKIILGWTLGLVSFSLYFAVISGSIGPGLIMGTLLAVIVFDYYDLRSKGEELCLNQKKKIR